MDFFTVPTLTGRVLFVLVLLSLHRRRIVHVNITDHTTATWSAQQMSPRTLHALTSVNVAAPANPASRASNRVAPQLDNGSPGLSQARR
jgi:hypothetical protein